MKKSTIKYLITILICILNFSLQFTVFNRFGIMGVTFNTTLILVVFFSLVFGNKQALTFAITGGLLQDVLMSSVIGVNVFIYVFIAVAIDFIDDSLFKDNTITPIILLITSTFIYNVIFVVFMFFLRETLNYESFIKITIIEMILNTLVGIVIYKFGIKKIVGYNLR